MRWTKCEQDQMNQIAANFAMLGMSAVTRYVDREGQNSQVCEVVINNVAVASFDVDDGFIRPRPFECFEDLCRHLGTDEARQVSGALNIMCGNRPTA